MKKKGAWNLTILLNKYNITGVKYTTELQITLFFLSCGQNESKYGGSSV